MSYKAAEGVSGAEVFEVRNVIRYRSTFPGEYFESELQNFTQTIAAKGAHAVGPLFYSLNNVPSGEKLDMDVEFFMPVEENYIDIPGAEFSSYIEINNLILTTVNHDFEDETPRAYQRLLDTLSMNNIDVNTPFYHVLYPENGEVVIFLGYAY
ncbi:DUF5085 family protein [Alloscardovia theropitheci]|uniref:DUF5085 family protein n=1 Tax=Alloscardovia theropitheci TaxID=2496842 RepID=A0A4R0QT40_9BIFI|nr:DUF5085 family protein [Alloscardovia theropitheci]TCD54668.1 DUF5085 family protein [Alloscardovia theropitheci]